MRKAVATCWSSNGHFAPLQVAQLGSAARWSKQTGTFASRNPFARCSQPSTAQSATSNDRPPWRPNCSTSLTLSEIAPMPHRRGLMLLPLQSRKIRPSLSAPTGWRLVERREQHLEFVGLEAVSISVGRLRRYPGPPSTDDDALWVPGLEWLSCNSARTHGTSACAAGSILAGCAP